MVHHLSWVIKCLSNPCRRTVEILFNTELGREWIRGFLSCISRKVNAMAWIEFELTHFNVTVQYVNHYFLYSIFHLKIYYLIMKRLYSILNFAYGSWVSAFKFQVSITIHWVSPYVLYEWIEINNPLNLEYIKIFLICIEWF